ncbi:MAG: hypothetical protein WHS46_10395 [Desulfosoma sp.]
MNRDSKPGPTVFLVGTCHRDPQGFGRCRALLKKLNPDVILVEVSPFAVRLRRDHGRFFLKLFLKNLKKASAATHMPFASALRSPLIKPIPRQCALPFEFRAARQRFRETGSSFFCVDAVDASRLFMADWPELLSSANLERLLKGGLPLPPSASEQYARARWILAHGNRALRNRRWNGDSFGWGWHQREQWMEKTVRATLERLRPHRLVYLGGWHHVVPGDALNLYHRLHDLAPQTVLLDEADNPTVATFQLP